MKYSLCAPNDGDTMTVSGGGGFSGDVDRGSAWSGGGNGGDRGSSDNGGNKNNKPVRLFTGGPIIVVKDNLRYVGIIFDENYSDEPTIHWKYDGSNNDDKVRGEQSKSPSSLYVEGFGKVSYSDKSEVIDELKKGGFFVGPGLILNRNKMLIYANGGICSATIINGKIVNVAFISTRERFGYNNKTRDAAVKIATMRANEYLQAQEILAKSDFPSVFTLRGSTLSSASGMQFAISGGGGAAISDSVQIRLTQLLSEFWSTASRIATASTAGPITAVLSLLTYSSKVGVGSDKVPGRNDEMMFSIPVKNLPDVTLPDNMADLASNKGSVNLPVRAAFVEKDGKMSLNLFKAGNTHVSASVKVVKGEFDKDTSTFRTEIFGVPDRIILESPASAPTANVDNTGSPQPDYKIPTHTGVEIKPVDTLTVTTTPVAEPVEFYDYIIWTPTTDGSGVEPVYVVFNSPRDLSGVVTGSGQKVEGTWLSGAGEGLGAPIPSQIADKLRGREFANFDAFRKAFWMEVSKDTELSKQFTQANQKRMSQGLAPRARYKDTVGGRRSFELHHDKLISQDGGVYDTDNVRVTTPKRHIDIHRGK